jgi:hypothetical protein
MSVNSEILSKLKIKPGTSDVAAIQVVREYLDSQSSPLKAANAIIAKVGINPIDNRKIAYVFAMTTVEQALHNMNPNIEAIIKKSNERIERITDLIGPSYFKVSEQEGEDTSLKKGPSKRSVARDIYLEHKDKGEKAVIEMVQKELGITKQNAYTYIYLVKKDLSL